VGGEHITLFLMAILRFSLLKVKTYLNHLLLYTFRSLILFKNIVMSTNLKLSRHTKMTIMLGNPLKDIFYFILSLLKSDLKK